MDSKIEASLAKFPRCSRRRQEADLVRQPRRGGIIVENGATRSNFLFFGGAGSGRCTTVGKRWVADILAGIQQLLAAPPKNKKDIFPGSRYYKDATPTGFSDIRQICVFPCLIVAAFALTGCETAKFYSQAARGQYEVLSRRQPCDKLIADPNTPTDLKGRLVVAAQICDFAEHDLNLPAHGDYRRYADLGRPYVVWNVSATPEFSLEAQQWWYPIIGNQGYRGYFTKDAATNSASQLAKKQLDVCVEGVEAYSTLGWFSDPLLNTFIRYGDASLAEILFHEIAHQRVFASGDTDFNEAFATTVGQEGVRRWLRSRQDEALLARYETALRRNLQFVHLVSDTRKKLEALYGDKRTASGKIKADPEKNENFPPEELRRQKEKIYADLREGYAQLKKEWGGYSGYDEWFARDLNNAKLNTVATYYDLVPSFERLLAACDGDLNEFYSTAKRLTTMTKSERRRRLEGFAPPESHIAGKSTVPADQRGE